MKLKIPYSIEKIAQLTDSEIITQHHSHITGINEIHKVTTGDLSFVDHPKYYQKSLTSAASVVLINQKTIDNPSQKTLLFHPEPFEAYNKLVDYFHTFVPAYQNIATSANIHPTAIIQHGVVVGADVTIGKNCIIHPNVVIYAPSQIGDNVIIHANTTVGADAYYFKNRPDGYDKLRSCGRVIIKNDVEIGANCTIDRGVSGDTIIGEGTKIDNQVHIGHGVVVGKHCLIAAQVGIAGKTTIGNRVTLWGQVGVSKSLTIGDNAIIYAQSGVSKSLKGNQVYFGSPAGEARKMMKQRAMLRYIPKILNQLKVLQKEKT